MKLILTRHGETEENVKEIVQGQTNGKFTEKGIKQIRNLALRLKNEKIDAIYSSRLGRAIATAEEIAKYHDLKINYTADINERNLGIFEGKHVSELEKEYAKIPFYLFKPKNGESLKELQERTMKFINKLTERRPRDNVLIVSHAGVNKAIITSLFKIPLEHFLNLKQGNASINLIEIDENKGPILHVFNDTSHHDN